MSSSYVVESLSDLLHNLCESINHWGIIPVREDGRGMAEGNDFVPETQIKHVKPCLTPLLVLAVYFLAHKIMQGFLLA